MKAKIFFIILGLLVIIYSFNSKFSQAEDKMVEDWQTKIEKKLDQVLTNQENIISSLKDLDRLVRTRKVN
ncbi:MAG: hypothetical protein Q8O13_04200 [Candidatus Omnitrophota bacterium]|nr:hypothetical protein [Candidatus Omnitrophota bacterium]